ncbi:MAG: FMN-binding protein [Spirochaetales bacterium]
MSSEQETANEKGFPPSSRLVLTLALIAMMSGITVVFAYEVTRDPIARNHSERLVERTIFEALPDAETHGLFRLDDDGIEQLSDTEVDDANLYAGYDEDGNLVGVALEGASQGYEDVVRVMYGYSPDDQEIIGLTVMESSETPGLGDEISSDSFQEQFADLDVPLTSDMSELDQEISVVDAGSDTGTAEIEAISGATVSTQAVADGIQESASKYLPLVMQHLDEIKEGAN